MTAKFDAEVSAWVRESRRRMVAVFRESAQRVISEMQKPVGAGGNLPVDTGFLRASLQVTTDTPARIQAGRPSTVRTYEPTAAVLTIAGWKPGQPLFACYTASYAPFVEYGTSKMQGRHFVALAAQRWPSIVAQVCRELQSRNTPRKG